MSINLKLEAIIFLILAIILILFLVKTGKITIKYSLIWLIPFVFLLIFAFIPSFLQMVTNFLGFQTGSNMIMIILIVFLWLISLTLTIIVSKQKEQIRLLIQEVSILKKRKND